MSSRRAGWSRPGSCTSSRARCWNAPARRSASSPLPAPVVELVSGAGHDAMILAAAGVPSGMLFVRSLNGGVSHSPEELSSPADVALAVDVLADALVRIVR